MSTPTITRSEDYTDTGLVYEYRLRIPQEWFRRQTEPRLALLSWLLRLFQEAMEDA